MRKRAKLIVLIVMIILMGVFASGCFFLDFLFGEEDEAPEDLTPKEEEKELEPDLKKKEKEEDVVEKEPLEVYETTFYLLDEEMDKLVPISREISRVEGIAQKTLSKMVRDEENIELWAEYELSPIIPAGTEIIGMAIDDDGNARVNFTEEFLNYEGEIDQLLDAVVYTLTEFETIDKVEFMVEGQLLQNLPEGSGIEGKMEPVGVNSEVPVVADEDGRPLTLYFVAEKEENTYYVPVTRMISDANELEGQALAELVRGPDPDSTLESYVSPEISLNDIELDNSILSIDVSNLTAEDNKKEQAARQIIYTLEEFESIDQVQLLVDGEEVDLD